MMRFLFILCFFGLSAAHARVKAPHPHPILEQEKKCKDTECWKRVNEDWDKELNLIYKKLMKSIEDKKTQEVLRESQKAWIKFRDAELQFFKKYYDQAGTIWGSVCIKMKVRITKKRVEDLYTILESVDMSGDLSENYTFE